MKHGIKINNNKWQELGPEKMFEDANKAIEWLAITGIILGLMNKWLWLVTLIFISIFTIIVKRGYWKWQETNQNK